MHTLAMHTLAMRRLAMRRLPTWCVVVDREAMLLLGKLHHTRRQTLLSRIGALMTPVMTPLCLHLCRLLPPVPQ